jgi:hypothetical protein
MPLADNALMVPSLCSGRQTFLKEFNRSGRSETAPLRQSATIRDICG